MEVAMRSPRKTLTGVILGFAMGATTLGSASAAKRDQLAPWPNDLSPAGLRAAASQSSDPALQALLPANALAEVQRFVSETRALGLERRSDRMSVSSAG